jgi:hypothetical protein
MNAKDIENKVKALYKNVEPDHFLKKDTYQINAAIHSDRMKKKYKDPEYREAAKVTAKKKYIENPDFAKKVTKHITKMNKERFAHQQYVFRTPGSDLLDFYDKMWEQRDAKMKCRIQPSVVYQLRFLEEYEKGKMQKKILDICSKYIDVTDINETFAKDTKKHVYKWLTTEKSKQYTFDTQQEVLDFLLKEYNTKSYIPVNPNAKKHEKQEEYMWWHSKLVGCSIIVKEKG